MVLAAKSCSPYGFPQRFLNLRHDFRDALLFFENIVGELFGWEMLEVGGGVGVLAVEVAAVGEQFGGGNFSGAFIFLAALPPNQAAGEFLELDRLGFGIVLSAFGQRLFVVPDFFRRMGAVEEHEIGWDAGVGCEDAVGQPDDGVEIEVFEQFLLDAGADAVAEERAVGNDDRGSARFRPGA